jgi:Ca2+-binding RTX toxin-like protein
MANYYNQFGVQNWTGTTGADLFYLFNKSTNQNDLRVDAQVANFSWTTSLHNADGTNFVLLSALINISTDLVIGDRYDAIYGSNSADIVVYNNGGFGDGLGGFRDIQLMYLGAGNDIVDLTAHGAGGVAYAKDMKIYAGDGDDTLIGGAGSDVLYGEAGNDLIVGFAGADTIYGGDGDDRLYGDDFGADNSSSYDTLFGQRGTDVLYGGGRADKLDGGDDDDILYGGGDDDSLKGGSGNDILWGDDATNTGNDKLQGEAGNDTIYGLAGNDEVSGGSGNDLLIGGAGRDYIDGGADIDTAVFSGNRADYLLTSNANGTVTLEDLRAGSPDGIDTLLNLEFVSFADGTIDFANLNFAPVITSNGGGSTAGVAFDENGLGLITTVTATDPDAGQTIRYRIVGGVDAALFLIDAATGALSFAQKPDFEDPIDTDRDNVYQLIVAADDGAGGIARQTLSVTVQDVADGAAPTITSNGGGSSASLVIAENTQFVTTIAASDPDGDTLRYVILGGADAAKFSVDAITGALTFIAGPDFENPGDADRNGVYQITIGATDGTNTDRQALSIAVGNVNDNTPVFTSFGGSTNASAAVDENSLIGATFLATDADGDPLSYRIVGGADAARFVIDPATGVLRFIAAPDFEMPGDAGADNIYDVIVEASDGVFSTSQSLALRINNLNDNAPVIVSNGGGTTASLSLPENGRAVTTVVATDADSSAITYRISGGADAGLFAIDSTSGALTLILNPDFEHPIDQNADNVYEVTVVAGDGQFSTAQVISLRITDVNEIGRTLTGNGAANVFSPTAALALQTTALEDTIYGLGGNDTIDGGGAADRMEGGIGNDTYFVDTWSDNGFAGDDDRAIEVAGAGTDQVFASVNYRLDDNVENLTLTSAALFGWGNALNNVITGNVLDNTLDAGAGNDQLYGGDGADTLIGGAGTDLLYGQAGADFLSGDAGSDVLDGGTGADRMAGGLDNDTYYIDSWSDDGNSANDDVVVEAFNEGNDVAYASVSYVLAANVERLILTGSTAIDGSGNDLANTITGNAATNRIFGLDGNDTIDGAGGDDYIDGGNGNDILNGGDGNDELYGGLAPDTLNGGTGADRLYGGDSNDVVSGGTGDDLVVGGKGKDSLTGGADHDSFLFAFGDTSATAGSSDVVTDFVSGFDSIDIDVFAGPLSSARYAETAMSTTDQGAAFSMASSLATGGVSAVFVAGTNDGWLFWDGNGDGLLDQAIVLSGLSSTNSFSNVDII